MKSLITLFSLLVLLSLLLSTITTAQNLIEKTCKQSSETNPNIKYGFCSSSLQAAPASRCAALRGLGSIAIRLVRYNLTDTRCETKMLLKNNLTMDPFVKSCLMDCFDLYSDAMLSVKQAMKSFNFQRYDDANIQISSIMDAASTCEDGFKERKGLVSPLKKRNDDAFALSAIVLSIMNLLQKRSQY
ncbi:putative invertase inhibitor [Impatiens glandulifera]|uniref:putative invertase inhibitor n=1 Tax=Impatiens glandulifera TaxID=253017 RepID=UPI001FB19DC4|nr:putative invertase inhibitor [Impatiens glandulifera]